MSPIAAIKAAQIEMLGVLTVCLSFILIRAETLS